MKKLKTIDDFQKENLFIQKQELMNYKAGTADYQPGPGDLGFEDGLPGGGTGGSTAGAFGSGPSGEGSGGGANTSYYGTTSRNGASDRKYCSKQDNPLLPGYGDNGGVYQCVIVG